MRLRELRLIAFGPFSDVTLDFGAREAGMHVIYGPNEAGKSTSLRAITALLYGVPARTADAHLHDNNKLRIGGVIEHGRGERLDVVRRKGRKRTLLDRDENPVDEALMTRARCGVSQALFVTMFGLDHVSLRDGAQALLRGDGDVGESLFDAGGARGIGRVLDELYEEAEQIYKPRGQAPKLNDALKRLKDIKQSILLKEMLPSAWHVQRQATEEARAEYAKLVERRVRLGTERHRLQRALRAFPHLARRREIVERTRALGHVPSLAADARSSRVAAEQERLVCGRRREELSEEIATLVGERDALSVDDELAELDEDVMRDIGDRLGNHRKALGDLPKREAALTERRRDAEAKLAELGRDVPLEEVQRLRLNKPARAKIDGLRNVRGRHVAELESARRARDEARARREVLDERLRSLPEARDLVALRRVVAEVSRGGDVEERRAELGARLAELGRRVGALTARLGDVAPPAPPSRALVAAHRELLGQLAAREEERARASRKADERRELAITELAELAELGAPSPHDLEGARRRRDQRWSEIVAGVSRGTEVAVGPFEEASRECDRVADRLWQQAERVAKRARLTAELAAVERERAALAAEARALCDERAQAEQRWVAAWSANAPATPDEAERWLEDHDALGAARLELAAVEQEAGEVAERLARHRHELGAWVGEGELSEQLDRAEALTAAEDERRHRRRGLEDKLAELDEQIAVFDERYRTSEAALAAWQEAWRDAVSALGLAEDASVDEVAAVEGVLAELFERVREADDLSRRIEGMRRDAAQFEAVLEPLLRRFAPALAGEPLERAAEGLMKRYRDNQAARARRDELDDKIAQKREQLGEVVARDVAAEHTLAELVRVAGAADVSGLEAIEERALELERLRQALRETEGALFAEGSIEELDALTRDLDVDETRERANDIEEDHKSVTERCEQLSNTIGANERGLYDLEHKEGAAAAAAMREETLATIVRHVERYARVRLAAVVLEREIERYRQENQGPILARAGEIFPRLTLGRYASLSVGFDDRDEPSLRCTRADGTEVDVAGLSDGTRDQLYLALRLASLERYGERGELLPFVVDDVLIHFDDERARAALSVLAELGRKTQVLFFTHHARLVELARDIEGVCHHRLG